MVNKLNRKLLLLSIFFVSIAIASLINLNNEITAGTFVGRLSGFIGYYNYNDIGFLNVNLYPSEVITSGLFSIGHSLKGISLIVIVISCITNLPPRLIFLFPFGIFFSMIAYYALCNYLFNSYKVSVFILVYSALLSFASSDLLGAYASAWTTILFLLSLLVFVRAISKGSMSQFVIILIVLYFGLFLYWHTVEANFILLLLSYNLILVFLLICKKVGDVYQNWDLKLLILPSLICLINSVMFKEFLIKKEGYIGNISFDILFEAYELWFYKILSKIGLMDPSKDITEISPYIHVQSGNLIQLSSVAGLILVLLLLLPIILSCVLDLQRLFMRDLSWIGRLSLFKWSLVMVQVLKTLLYGVAGGAGPGLIISFFPVISILSLYQIMISNSFFNHTENKKLVKIYLSVVIIFAFVYLCPTILNNIDETKHTQYNDLASTSEFYIKLNSQGHGSQTTLTDFMLAGKMLTLLGERGQVFDYKCISPETFRVLTSYERVGDRLGRSYYILLNTNELKSPLYMDQGWEKIVPIGDKINALDIKFSKIRSDGITVLYCC